ncbi:Structural maintenance of chromosomes protein 1 [Malassezia cuniculi]|uniref:Structural maintenance of chromosomes protein n=1 Tax=Malassezia cuniculi TaxID=948313 RepID=A0AAF0ESC5_9BASI|nr:Structural maintenance of chromosomes protein 1 [Malassezia cuniculi]
MPLKLLELDNFKSYRGHHVIGPFSSFSAIIGPNGSGKSNLLDAISFVLCVDSNIRAAHLADLVFRDAPASPPLVPDPSSDLSDLSDLSDSDSSSPASPSATSVTAVIQDAHVLHRFQRAVRNASSEFRYNGRVVSLALYTSRLEQLNVRVRARNFLVFQGDIEAIASQHAPDLARLIDDISGSAALRDDYDAAHHQHSLALARSSSLLARRKTLQSQLRQLRQQHDASERHRSLRDVLAAAAVRRTLWRLYHIHELIELHTDWIVEHRPRAALLASRLNDRAAAVADARARLGAIQHDILASEDAQKLSSRALDARRPERVRLQERIAHAENKLAQATDLLAQTAADEHRQRDALVALDRDVELVQRASRQARDEQDAALAASAVHVDDAAVSAYHELRALADRSATAERRDADHARRELRIKRDVADGARNELDSFRAKHDRLAHEADAAHAALAALEHKQQSFVDRAAALRARLAALRDKKQSFADREAVLNDALLRCYNKLLSMGHDQRLHERDARLRDSLRALRSIYPGVHGRLADLVRPTQQKFDLALTTALGRNLDAVVVDHERTAIECIEYLRNQRAGHATFIPLDSVHTRPVVDRLRSISLHARLAVDVVQYPPAIERAVQYACGNTLICDSLDVARHVAYDRNEHVKSVSLDGTVIHKNGMITGGPSAADAARHWDEQEFLAVQRERDRCMSELQRLHHDRFELGDEDDAAAALAQLDSERAAASDDVSAARRRLAAAQSELEQTADAAAAAADRLAAADAAVAALQSRVDDLDVLIRQADDAVFADWAQRVGVASVREYEENQLRVAQALDRATAQHQRQLARLDHQKAFASQQLHATRERIAQLQRVVAKEKDRIPRLHGEADAVAAELDDLQRAVDAATHALDAHRAAHTAQLDVLAECRRAHHAASRDLDALRGEIASRNDEIDQLDTERTALFRKCRLDSLDLPLVSGSLDDVPLEHIDAPQPPDLDQSTTDDPTDADADADADSDTARPVNDYGIVPDYSALSDSDRSDRSSAKGKQLQELIDAALDELQRLAPASKTSARLASLEHELSDCDRDMDAAREHVRAAREEFSLIKRQRADLFMRAYTHIADRIDAIYKELTRSHAAPMGGVAYLSVEDSDEPFNAGIRYHAMPPMKRFRDMEQLSGGEKSMAALALLFAIHTFHPAPFFVLDEVDAALDAQNVARISDYIRAHASDRFQFIVISLKASLYERSQALLGIFRDAGRRSSACLTLDLEQYAS